MSDDLRKSLFEQQAALVAALKLGRLSPDGFDSRCIAAAAQSLARKRSREVARSWPSLVESCGEQFERLFVQFAAADPPAADGPSADGCAFAQWLRSRGRLNDSGRLALGVWRGRRGFPLRAVMLPDARRLVLLIRGRRRIHVLATPRLPLGIKRGEASYTAPRG